MKQWNISGSLAIFIMTACNTHQSPAAKAEGMNEVNLENSIKLDKDGLLFIDQSGRQNRIAIGSDRSSVAILVSDILSENPEPMANEECGAGPMEFDRYDGLTLNFQDGKFVGWVLTRSKSHKFETSDGLTVGMFAASTTIQENYRSLSGSTLGREFYSSKTGISGLINGMRKDSRVTDLWAGTNCHFR